MKTGSCSCQKCRNLCLGIPGWFLPEEATAAAKSIGMPFREFFLRFLGIAIWYGGGDTLVLTPRTETDQDRLYGDRYHGACKLLGKDGCMLPYSKRPEECRVCYGCQEREGDIFAVRKRIKNAWIRAGRRGRDGWSNEISAAWDIYMGDE